MKSARAAVAEVAAVAVAVAVRARARATGTGQGERAKQRVVAVPHGFACLAPIILRCALR